MKLYDFSFAPNCKRVRVYLAEKGIEVPVQPVDLTRGEHRTPEYLAKNPRGTVPVLELDDGTCYAESVAIVEYFEERHPDPPMIGSTPEERLRVREIERMCELGVFLQLLRSVRHTHPFFASFVKQEPSVAENARSLAQQGLAHVDRVIADHPFVAGERPTIADCTLYAGLLFAKGMQQEADLAAYPNVARWWAAFAQRPSTNA